MREATLVSGPQCQQCCIDEIYLVLAINSAGDEQFRILLPKLYSDSVSLQGVLSFVSLAMHIWLSNTSLVLIACRENM